MGDSKNTKQESERAESGCCGMGDNSMMYMAVLFLIGIVIGAFIGYSYVGVTPTGTNISTCSAGMKNTTSEKAILDKIALFLNDELLSGQGVTAKIVGSDELTAKVLTIGIYSEGQQVQTGDMHLVNGSLLLWNCQGADISKYGPGKTEPAPTPSIPKTNKPEIKFFVMSFCPYGQQAETGLKPVGELLGDKVVLEPHFVIYKNYGGGGPDYCLGNGTYCSMHTVSEVKEDVRQMCLWKYDKAKWWSYVASINSKCTYKNVDTCWKDAANATGVDIAKIETCEKDEGLALLEAELKLNDEYAKKLGEPNLGSPLVFINDVKYLGSRNAEAYKSAVCGAFNTVPIDCNKTLDGSSALTSGSCE